MKGKKHRPEQIVTKLRQAQIELGKGATVEQICRKLQINEQTYYRWKRDVLGLIVGDAQAMDIDALKEIASKKS